MSVWVRQRQQPDSGVRVRSMPIFLPAVAGGSGWQDISVTSIEDALRSIAIHAAVDLFASLASELPMTVYEGIGPGRRPVPTPGYLDDPAGDGYGRQDWSYQLAESLLLRGNAYGQVLARAPGDYPIQIDLWHPDRVSVSIDDGRPLWTYGGKRVENPDDFKHFRVNPIPGYLLGLSVIRHHATQIELPLTAGSYGLSWFREGAHPSMALSSESIDMSKLDDDQTRLIKQRFLAGLNGTREPALLGRGWTIEKLQVAPEESQFLGTLGASEAQCCRMFGPGVAEILGYESGGSLTYANVESRLTHLLILSLDKWLLRLERAFTAMLPKPQYAELNRDAILNSTTLARYTSHASALKNRWKTVNEVREIERLRPVPWGDEPNDSGSTSDDGDTGE